MILPKQAGLLTKASLYRSAFPDDRRHMNLYSTCTAAWPWSATFFPILPDGHLFLWSMWNFLCNYNTLFFYKIQAGFHFGSLKKIFKMLVDNMISKWYHTNIKQKLHRRRNWSWKKKCYRKNKEKICVQIKMFSDIILTK